MRHRRFAHLAGLGIAAGSACILGLGCVTPVAATLADAGNWSDAPSSPSTVVPIFCNGATTVNPGTSGASAVATAACSDSEDDFSYQWTWTDENTGAILASGGSTLHKTSTVSSASGTSAGTPGHRQAQVCFTTAKAGYQTVTTCLTLQHL